MKILIDIGHLADFNFLKFSILKLHSEEHEILVSVLDRGKLSEIATKELKNISVVKIGKHRGSILSIIFEANFLKFFRLLNLSLKFKPDIGLSPGSFLLGAVLKIQGKPNIQFDDDLERPVNVFLEKITSTRLYFPIFYFKTSKYVRKYNALKEWAYLSPKYFSPDPLIVNYYKLEIKKYIFIREVSNKSLNYYNQNKNCLADIAQLFPANLKVLFSLEDKGKRHLYPEEWILLEEPILNFHSLLYYSAIVISSGDSMAREGAVLGVPSVYCGFREMEANKILIDLGMLYKIKPMDIPEFIKNIFNNVFNSQSQEKFRNKLLLEWDDVNECVTKSLKEEF